MKSNQFLILIITLISSVSNTQNAKTESIDAFISKTLNQFKEVPSLTITVVKDNKSLFTKAYGYTDVEKKVKATTTSSYYIASVTKSFVGLLAAELENQGILDLNKPITEYAPIKDFKDKTIFEGITITDLLSHTSGINNVFFTWRFASIGDYTKQDMIHVLEEKTESVKNDKAFRYDNFGYNVFDLILSQEFGLNWKILLQERIFNPLQMTHASAYLSEAKKKNWNLAQPYTSINDEGLPTLAMTQKDDQTFQAAGGILMSIEDMQQWLIMNMNNGSINNIQVFDKKVIEKTHSSISNVEQKGSIFNDKTYGLGWRNAEFGEHKALYHFGGFDGYFSHMSFLPEENIGIAVFVNESHFGDNVANLIASYVYDILLGKINQTSDYDEKTSEVAEKIQSTQNRFKEDRQKRSDRQWTLTYDFKHYAGDYENKYAGVIHIEPYNESLKANLGISTAIASPSTKDDSIRVEFRDGQGSDILFISNEKETVAAVYGGYVYFRK